MDYSIYALVGVTVGRGTLHLYVVVGVAVYGRGRAVREIDGWGNDDREKDVAKITTPPNAWHNIPFLKCIRAHLEKNQLCQTELLE